MITACSTQSNSILAEENRAMESSIPNIPEKESSSSKNIQNIIPRTTESLSEIESYFLSFAQSYSICCNDRDFCTADELNDAEKYRFFLFIQTFINTKNGDPYQLEKELYNKYEDAVEVPVSVVRQWLLLYLGTDQFNPSNALPSGCEEVERYGRRPFGYDSKADIFVVPSLSGFGGVRACGLLDSKITDGVITMNIGLYNPDKFDNKTPEYELYAYVKMKIKLISDDPMQFQLISWDTFPYRENEILSD